MLPQSAADKIEGVLRKLLSPGHEVILTATRQMYSSNLLPLHVHCRELETAAGKIRPVLILCEIIIIIPLHSVEKNGNCSNYYFFFAYVHIIIVVISQMQTLSSQKGILRNPTFSCMLALWFVLQALTRAELNMGESQARHQPQLTCEEVGLTNWLVWMFVALRYDTEPW